MHVPILKYDAADDDDLDYTTATTTGTHAARPGRDIYSPVSPTDRPTHIAAPSAQSRFACTLHIYIPVLKTLRAVYICIYRHIYCRSGRKI